MARTKKARKQRKVSAAWREFAKRAAAFATPREGYWSESYPDTPEGRRAARRRARALRGMGHVTRYQRQDAAPFGCAYVLNIGRQTSAEAKRDASAGRYRFEIVMRSTRSNRVAYQFVNADDAAAAREMATPKNGYVVSHLYRTEN